MSNIISTPLATAKNAFSALKKRTDEQTQDLLKHLAIAIERNSDLILAENQKDLAILSENSQIRDHISLSEQQITQLAQSVRTITTLNHSKGKVLVQHQQNGLLLEKIEVPLGVIGLVCEDMPNLLPVFAALCLRSGNACLLQGGANALHTHCCLVELIQNILQQHHFPKAAVQLLSTDKATMLNMLRANHLMAKVVACGSNALIDFVRTQTTIPLLAIAPTVCHILITQYADLKKTINVLTQHPLSQFSLCSALNTLVIEASMAEKCLPSLLPSFEEKNIEIFADERAFPILDACGEYHHLYKSDPEDFEETAFFPKYAIKIVDGLAEGLAHIQRYSTKHAEAIITESQSEWEHFMEAITATTIYKNASVHTINSYNTPKTTTYDGLTIKKLLTTQWIGIG